MRIRTALVAACAATLAGGGTAWGAGAPVAGLAYGGEGVASGTMRYVALPSHGGTAVAQIDRASGTVNRFVSLGGSWGIPQVAFDGTTAGLSADGRMLVLGRGATSLYPKATQFALLDAWKMRLERTVTLKGAFYFDAISPDGATMYLIQLTTPRNLLRYAVRAYDLSRDRLVPGAIVDTTEPDERMAGMPIARAASADGVWAYTLYEKPSGRFFIHALDTSTRTARCIDLPTLPIQQSPRLSVAGGRLVLSEGQPLASIDRETFKVTRSPAPFTTSSPAPPTPQTPARRPSDGAPIWVAVPAGLFLAGFALLAVRRRRPARDGRSGGAAAGAPSGP